jgi:hypothetical protein
MEYLIDEQIMITLDGGKILISFKFVILKNMQDALGNILLQVANHMKNLSIEAINYCLNSMIIEEDDCEYKFPIRL